MLVGEIRDGETASIAVQAALTGHLVFSTLHTNTAIGAVTRPARSRNRVLPAVVDDPRDLFLNGWYAGCVRDCSGTETAHSGRALAVRAKRRAGAGARTSNLQLSRRAPTRVISGVSASTRSSTSNHALREKIHDNCSERELLESALPIGERIAAAGLVAAAEGWTTVGRGDACESSTADERLAVHRLRLQGSPSERGARR